MSRLAALRNASGRYVYRIFLFKIMSERGYTVGIFFTAYLAYMFMRSLCGTRRLCYGFPFAPGMSCRLYLAAVGRGVAPRAMSRLATLRNAIGCYVYRIFLFEIMSERRYTLRFVFPAYLAYMSAQPFIDASRLRQGCPFAPGMSERVYFSAVSRRVTAYAVTRFAAGVLARRGDVFGVLFFVVVTESVDRFALRFAAHFTFAGTLAVLRACSRRCVSPFAPCVRVLPYRIKRYVGAHGIGQEIPHPFSACVQSKPDKPRTLFGRRRNLSDDLSVPDSYIRNIIAALRIEPYGKICTLSVLRLGIFPITSNEDTACKHKTAHQRDQQKPSLFHNFQPPA